MVEIDALVQKNIQLFLDKLRAQGISINKAYLFGSFVTGRNDQWSDIDLAIVSPQIGDDRLEERVRLTEIATEIDDRFEPMPFNLKTFDNNDPFVREIIKTGLAVN